MLLRSKLAPEIEAACAAEPIAVDQLRDMLGRLQAVLGHFSDRREQFEASLRDAEPRAGEAPADTRVVESTVQFLYAGA